MKLLECYPFKDRRVRLIEGFSAYDGALGDKPGEIHKGIDYALRCYDRYQSFRVFAMHTGRAFTGTSETWGKYVIVYTRERSGLRYNTVYAHLDQVDQFIPFLIKGIPIKQGLLVRAGSHLGIAGTTGQTNNILQLHIELHEKNLTEDQTSKLDPYGIFDRASSKRYPQPGSSLSGLKHFWITDEPPLAS